MTQVEKKAQPYLPFIPISGNSPHRKSTIELHGTATDPHYGISPMWGSSLGPGGPQPYTLTKSCHSLLLCTFLLAPANLTFHSPRHFFADSIYFFFGLPASRFPTHSPLYI